jgi:hypothetical protein
MSKSSTYYEPLKTLVTESGSHLFDYQEDGFLLFTKDGSRVHHLADLTADALQAARDFIEAALPNDPPKEGDIVSDPECDGIRCDSCNKDTMPVAIDQMFTVNLRLDTLFSPNTVTTLNNVISKSIDTTQILLRFQFQEPPDTWGNLLESFCNHWQEMRDKKRLLITLSGVFRELSEKDFDFFVKNDIQLEYVCPFVEGVPQFSEEPKAVISQIAGKGLRLPIVWYINESTLGKVLPLVDEAMSLNFNSGFSVPLAHYSLFADGSREPDEESYLSFLADVYERHIFYDDVLFPLNFVLINALKMDKVDFWKIMTFDPLLVAFSPVLTTELDSNVFAFFSRLFLWQRWESVFASQSNDSSLATCDWRRFGNRNQHW